jgi:hypothetical protein
MNTIQADFWIAYLLTTYKRIPPATGGEFLVKIKDLLRSDDNLNNIMGRTPYT